MWNFPFSSMGSLAEVIFALWNKDFSVQPFLVDTQSSEMHFEKLFSFLKVPATTPPRTHTNTLHFQSQLPDLSPALQGQFLLYLLKDHSKSFKHQKCQSSKQLLWLQHQSVPTFPISVTHLVAHHLCFSKIWALLFLSCPSWCFSIHEIPDFISWMGHEIFLSQISGQGISDIAFPSQIPPPGQGDIKHCISLSF